jgi:hypothetical protein
MDRYGNGGVVSGAAAGGEGSGVAAFTLRRARETSAPRGRKMFENRIATWFGAGSSPSAAPSYLPARARLEGKIHRVDPKFAS